MLRVLSIAAPLALLAVAASAPAQTTSRTGERCEQPQQESTGRRLRRGVLGGLGRSVLGRVGVPTSIAGAYLPVGELLDEAISSMLDCQEQQKAATATNEAVRGGVGTTSTWESETRPGVRGSSTVTAQEQSGDGQCMTVTDIVIVDGEETRAPKRMCRRPPSTRYVRV